MRGVGAVLSVLFCLPAVAGVESPIKSDEEVVFFPTVAHRVGDAWVVAIHGWIFEPEEDSVWRADFTKALGDVLELLGLLTPVGVDRWLAVGGGPRR